MRKSKSVIYSIFKNLEEPDSIKAKKPPGRPMETTTREDR